jgi:hypothetical protein
MKRDLTPSEAVAGRPFPLYQCHKVVHAIELRDLDLSPPRHPEASIEDAVSAPMLLPMDPLFPPIAVTETWIMTKIGTDNLAKIRAGGHCGWYVVYDDGYTSWSPDEAFSTGYHGPLPQGQDSQALVGRTIGREEDLPREFFSDLTVVVVAGPFVLLQDENGKLWEWSSGSGIRRARVERPNERT